MLRKGRGNRGVLSTMFGGHLPARRWSGPLPHVPAVPSDGCLPAVPSAPVDASKDDGVPSITENRGQCQMCRQMHILVDQGMCEACNLGRRYVFRYECQRCHRLQRIPHPMWRYQATPTDFSSSTWACHQGCGDYTTWRLAPEDVGQVPDMECPESWGRREEWLEQVRRLRHSGQRPETSPRCVVS
ncbi:unnamed protein product [Durusdinium trenchii]|uniref:Uncharacterized protein n=1 Tax=Durusdinium trenchii TaxID=1381693 RepID=A0ABP0PER4_9DINO